MGDFSVYDFVTAVGLAFVIEGLIFLALPEGVRRVMASVAASPATQLRISGLVSAVIGLIVIWLVRIL